MPITVKWAQGRAEMFLPAGSGTTSIKFSHTQRLYRIGGKAPIPKRIHSREQNYPNRLVQCNSETQKAALTTSIAILLKKDQNSGLRLEHTQRHGTRYSQRSLITQTNIEQ